MDSIKCIWYAVKKFITSRDKPVKHWLDRADKKFDNKLLSDVKCTLRVLLLFTSYPLFWALFYQTSTGMIFQAKRLYDRIGNYRIPPELVSTVNPFLILVLIPLFEFVIYPQLAKKQMFQTMIPRMSVGMGLGCVSFIIYGLVGLQVEQNILGANQAQLNIYNVRNCQLRLTSDWLPHSIELSPGSQLKFDQINLADNIVVEERKMRYECGFDTIESTLKLGGGNETAVVVFPDEIRIVKATDHYLKDKDAEAKVRFITDTKDRLNKYFKLQYGDQIETITVNEGQSDFEVISPQNYTVRYEDKTLGIADIRQDGVYDIVISDGHVYSFFVTEPSETHMLWLIPQFLIITTGEVLFSVSSMDFAYTEAPKSMKSVMQAANLFTITVGLWLFALITKISTATKMFEYRASNEAFAYAVAMGINTIFFLFLARYYVRNKAEVTKEDHFSKQGEINVAFQEEHRI